MPPEERSREDLKAATRSRDGSEERAKSRDRSGERSRRKRSRSRSPSRSPSRGGRRSRSRSRDRYKDDRRRHDRRDRDRDRDRREYGRDRSRSRERRRGGREYREPPRRRDDHRGRRRDAPSSLEEEHAKLERTYRTVQVYNLSLQAGEKEVFKFFNAAGHVVDIKIIRDRTTGRSKGFAYVEFQSRESVITALSLGGQPLMGQPVMVKMSEAEKNMAWEAAQAAKKQAAQMSAMADQMAGMPSIIPGGMPGGMPGRLLVSNLPLNVVEADLRQIFDPFGPVDFLTLQRDTMGNSQGIALVQYKSAADAAEVTNKLNENALELAPGMPMKISPAPLDYNPMAAGAGMAGAMPMPGFIAPSVVEERIDVDADDGGGMKLTAQHRMALMTRLAVNAGIEMPQAPTFGGPGAGGAPFGGATQQVANELALEQGVLGPASPIPTQCLLLKNMFDPAEETQPGWDEEIAQDVREECGKFGRVDFVHVDAASKGFVYLKFDTMAAATAAQRALHGRWFNQKQLCADFQFTPLFNSHFKL